MPNIIETTDAPNNTATSYALTVGQTAQGHLSLANDSDWYRVTLIAGHTYTFAVAGERALTDNVQDSLLYLRDANGSQLALNDDGGPGLYSTITFTASTTGTYYLDVQSHGGLHAGQYGLSVTEGTRASYDVDMGAGAILTPFDSWTSTPATPATITFGFRQTAPTYSVGGEPNIATTFSQLTPAEMAAARTIMQLWSDVSGVKFIEVNPGGYTNSATILFSNYSDATDGAGAFSFYPDPGIWGGDVFLNTQSVSTSSLPFGSYSFFAIMHEVGHALGLSHPGDYNAAPGQSITYANNAQFIQDSQQYSVMSYFDESATGAQFNGYADTPMLFDIYAQQLLYGPNMTTRSGDTVYGFNNTAGSVYNFATNTRPAFAIWDAGGNDTLDCSGYSMAQAIYLNAGQYSNIGGLTQNIVIAYGATIEKAIGGSGSDTIVGNSVDNFLDGRAAADIMTGGLGNDTYVVDNAGDVVVENAAEGTDTVLASVSYTLGVNVENLILIETANLNGTGNGLVDSMTGGLGSDSYNGTGNALANILTGNAGDNILDGQAGADTMTGGLGNDTYAVDNIGDVVLENAAEGTDTIYSTVHLRLGANIENLVLQGTADLQGFGNNLANAIYGNTGNNVLDGDAGADFMVGGAGNDNYYVDNPGDTIVENTGEGTDTVYSTSHLRLAVNLENLLLQGSADLQGYGNNLSNAIYGNSGDNLLDGDSGADSMYGGQGNDTYYVDNIADVVVENANEGNDTVHSTANLVLAANVETLVLDGGADLQGYGNSLNNAIYGNTGDNLLDGGIGADSMYGGSGNDVYYVDNIADVVVENANEGRDTVFSTANLVLAANVEQLVLQGSADLQGYGNNLVNALYGNSGNNVLDGGGGADCLTGNAGNDTFVFHAGEANGDTIIDFSGNGAAAGDSMLFIGFGTTAQGATFTEIGTTNQWQVHSGLDGHNEVITLTNNATMHASDYLFV